MGDAVLQVDKINRQVSACGRMGGGEGERELAGWLGSPPPRCTLVQGATHWLVHPPARPSSPSPPPARLPPPPGQHVQALMRQQLERIVKTEGLSENVYEIASKSLKD